MKKIQLILFFTFLLSTTLFAQQKAVDKIVIKTPNATCEPCKTKIEEFMGDTYGVISVNVDIKKATTTILYVPERINKEELKTDLSNMGLDADDVPAEPTAIRYLPRCCQKKVIVSDSTKLKIN